MSSNDPEVAVIIPTYNCAAWLAEAIESVFAQTFRDFRIFVIDDGSTDDTAAVLQRYADRCVCLRQENAGAAAARNFGIRSSSSKYIAFLDADDLWHPNKLERQLRLIKQDPEAGLVCSDIWIDYSLLGNGKISESMFARSKVPPDGHVFEQLIMESSISTPTVLARRQAIEQVGMFNESLTVCEDMNLWLRIASRWKIAIIREILVTVRKRPGSLSLIAGGTIHSLKGQLAAYQHIESSCPRLSRRERGALRQVLATCYYASGSIRLSGGDRKAAREHLRIALRSRRFRLAALAKMGGSLLPDSAYNLFVGLYHRARG
jgi:GT2 family glycosyltransferase